jgi:hypothetical protein
MYAGSSRALEPELCCTRPPSRALMFPTRWHSSTPGSRQRVPLSRVGSPVHYENHREVIVALDFFTVPTWTFRLLYCFFVIEHGRTDRVGTCRSPPPIHSSGDIIPVNQETMATISLDESRSDPRYRAAVVVAHPDDETLWCGGYILTHPEFLWRIVTLSFSQI